jgi:hypothetical protein
MLAPRWILIILLFFAVICKSPLVFGQTFIGAAPEALGGTGRAATDALEAHYLNPAALAFTTGYKLGGTFQERNKATDSPSNAYAFVLTDNSGEKLAAGSFGYLHRRQSFPDHMVTDQDYSLNLARRILPTVAVGLQAHRLGREDSLGRSWTKYNSTLGVLVVPASYLGLAFVAYDMLNDDDLDMVPVLSLGLHVIVMDIMRIRADVTRQEKRNPNRAGTLGVGLEFDVGEGFLLRTGGKWDELNRKTEWSAGFGWHGPNLSVAYAYRGDVNVANDATHTFQAWLNF